MLELIALGAAGAASVLGFVGTRDFVRDRLRFVDAVQKRSAPFVAGTGAALVAAPVAWLLPVVGGGSALVFGAAVGLGVVRGRKSHPRLPGGSA